MRPNILFIVNALIQIFYHIGSGLPYLHIFVRESVALLGAMTDEWMRNLFCGQNQKISSDQVKFAAKKIKTNFIACKLSVNRVVSFGVVLYCNK